MRFFAENGFKNIRTAGHLAVLNRRVTENLCPLAVETNSSFIESHENGWQLYHIKNRLLNPFSPVIGNSEGL